MLSAMSTGQQPQLNITDRGFSCAPSVQCTAEFPRRLCKAHSPGMFNDNEMNSIILAVLRGSRGGAPESEMDDGIERVVDWGTKVRTQALLLDLIFSGGIVISVTPAGEIRFSRSADMRETPAKSISG
jgi:hypothetical protein